MLNGSGVGHILRADDNRLIKKALHHIYNNPQPGDILMDTDAGDWQHLQQQASDRVAWRKKVKQLAASTHDTTDKLSKKTTSKTRFHIRRSSLTRKLSTVLKKAKTKLSNVRSREAFGKVRRNMSQSTKSMRQESISSILRNKTGTFLSSEHLTVSTQQNMQTLWAKRSFRTQLGLPRSNNKSSAAAAVTSKTTTQASY